MAATTAGALKAYIEGLGLNISAYRDEAPKEAVYPYVLIHEDIVAIPDRDGDTGDVTSSHTIAETVQVSLWQERQNPATGANTERYTLPDDLVRHINGARLPAGPKRVYGCRVISRARVRDVDANLIHHALTVTVKRVV